MATIFWYIKLNAEGGPHLSWGHPAREGIFGRPSKRGDPVVPEQDTCVRFAEFLGNSGTERAMAHRALAGDELGPVAGYEFNRDRVGHTRWHGQRQPLNDREALTHLTENH